MLRSLLPTPTYSNIFPKSLKPPSVDSSSAFDDFLFYGHMPPEIQVLIGAHGEC